MKAGRQNTESSTPADTAWSPAAVGLFRDGLVAGLLALLVATPLVIGDTAAGGGFSAEVYPPIVLFMAWLLLPIGWAVMGLLSRRVVWRWERIDTVVIAMLACIVLSSMEMAWQGNPRAVIDMTWRWLVPGVAYLLMRQLLDQAIYRRAAVATMLAVAALLSTNAYYQYFYEMPQSRAVYEESPEELLDQQGIDSTPGSRERELFENRLYSAQPLATFALTNSLAGFLVPWLVVAVGLLVVNWREGSLRPLLPIGLGLVLVLAGGCMLLTESRSGYLAVFLGLVGVGLGAFGLRLKPKVLLGLIGAAVVLGAVSVGFVVAGGLGNSELVSGAPLSVRYRLEYWQATAAMIADYPWWGCGVGNFQDYYTAYMLPQASETIADPHNFLLEIWATAGTPAALCLLGAIVFVALRFTSRGERGAEDIGTGTVPNQAASIVSHARKRRQEGEGEEPLPPPNFRILAMGILLGPAVGWLLGYCGFFAPDIVGLLLGWPVLGAVVWFTRGWVLEGKLPAWLLAIAGAALLVNLLAAGGIGFPAVAISLWLLAALTVAGTGNQTRRIGQMGTALVAFLAALALGITYLMTAYWPPLASFSEIVEGDLRLTMEGAYLPDGSEEVAAMIDLERMRLAAEAYTMATASDPYSPAPYRYRGNLRHGVALNASLSWLEMQAANELAQEEAAQAEEQGPPEIGTQGPLVAPAEDQSTDDTTDEALADAEVAEEASPNSITPEQLTMLWEAAVLNQAEVIARDSHSASAYRQLGVWCLEAYYSLEDEHALADALRAFERAVELYPADSSGQAALAWAYHLAGNTEKATRHAQESLRLDDLNPHEDRALARQNLFYQSVDLPVNSPLRLAPVEGNPREWMEQLATPPAPAA